MRRPRFRSHAAWRCRAAWRLPTGLGCRGIDRRGRRDQRPPARPPVSRPRVEADRPARPARLVPGPAPRSRTAGSSRCRAPRSRSCRPPITDFSGESVTVSDVSRVLALDSYGTLATTVYALGLGERLVGRDVSTGIPELRRPSGRDPQRTRAERRGHPRPEPVAGPDRLQHRPPRGAVAAEGRGHPGRDHGWHSEPGPDRRPDPRCRRRVRGGRPRARNWRPASPTR